MLEQSATISDALRSSAKAVPEKPIIVDEHGEISYRSFDAQVDALGTFLAQSGLGPGDTAAYLLWNQRELLLSYHAITRISSVLVSLNYRLTAAELAHQLDATSAKFLIYDASLIETVLATVELLGRPIQLIHVGTGAPLSVSHFSAALETPIDPDLIEARRPSADDIAGIWFTSGTEAKPKGAVVRHRSAIAAGMMGTMKLGLHRNSRCLAVAPMFHRGAAENVALAVTLSGATHFLQPRFSAPAVLAALRKYRITAAFIVPAMGRMMLKELANETYPLPDLEYWISASAPLPVALEEELRTRFELHGKIVNAYGITEMLLVTISETAAGEVYDGSAGIPLPNVQVRIFDEVQGILPNGQVGEIIALGPCGFSHYLNNPEATAKATMMIDGKPWYRSGDIGVLEDTGSLTILDRKKDMILSGGENIYSAEVEEAILAHPDVTEVAVIGRENIQWGEIVVAFIVVSGATAPTLADIRSACANLAAYKHPKELVVVDGLPRNSFGKVQKAALRLRLPVLAHSDLEG